MTKQRAKWEDESIGACVIFLLLGLIPIVGLILECSCREERPKLALCAILPSIIMVALGLSESMLFSLARCSRGMGGTWGTCEWSLDADGLLTIGAGTGADVNYKAPWRYHADDITAVLFDEDIVMPENCAGLCADLSDAKSIELYGCDFSKVEDASQMFDNCDSLTHLDVSWWDVSNVKDMHEMFGGCRSLEELDVSGWDVSQVEDMDGMFWGCESLERLNLSGWDTGNVQKMNDMFYGCEDLKQVIIGEKYRMVDAGAFPESTKSDNMWYCVEDGTWYSHEDIISKRSCVACTYTREKVGQ